MLKSLIKPAHDKLPLPQGKDLFDLGIFMEGLSTPEELGKKLAKEDLSKFKDKIVQLRGCAPTWAYMILSHRFEGIAKGVEFRLADGKSVRVW